MSDEIVARFQPCRDRCCPRVVIIVHLEHAPHTIPYRTIHDTPLLDFEPFVVSWDIGAAPITRAPSHPHKKRALSMSPWAPVRREVVACLDWSVEFCWGSGRVTNHHVVCQILQWVYVRIRPLDRRCRLFLRGTKRLIPSDL